MENIEEEPNLENFCRLCLLKLKKGAVTINIFDMEISENVSIPMRIMACAALEVHANNNDGLPKIICEDCRYELEKSYYFRKRCQAADAKLRKHIRLLNLGKKSHIFDKNDEDFYDERIEFENSIKMIKAHEEKLQNVWKEAYRRSVENEMQKFRENCKLELYSQVVESVKKDLKNSVKEEVKMEIKEKVREQLKLELKAEVESEMLEANKLRLERLKTECRQKEINRLVTDLEEFLKKKKIETNEEFFNENDSKKTTKAVILESTSLLRVPRNGTESGTSLLLPQKTQQSVVVVDPVKFYCDNRSEEELKSFSACDINNEDKIVEENYLIMEETIEDCEENVSQTQIENNQENEIVTNVISKQQYNYEDNNDMAASVKGCDDGDGRDEGNVLVFNYTENVVHNVENKTKVENDDIASDSDIDMIEYIELDETKVVKRKDSQLFTKRLPSEDSQNKFTKSSSIFKGDTPKTFACDSCPITFSTDFLLQRHKKTHLKMEQKGVSYQCPDCKIFFSCQSALTRHQIIHTGTRPFVCSLCDRAFVQREILKRHMNSHIGLRPYSCSHCERSFSQKANLQQHINTNHLEIPKLQLHSCHLCTKRFNHASGLSRHLAAHAGVSFQCSTCSRTFGDRSSVKRHILICTK